MRKCSAEPWTASTIAWLAVMFVASLARCTTTECSALCPLGTVPDSTGCTCVQAGSTCDSNVPEVVQDGGAVLGNCCPRDVLQSTTRDPPTGACTGSAQCFVAVHQVCEGPMDPAAGSPLDEYNCSCDGALWRCAISSRGASICPPYDGGIPND